MPPKRTHCKCHRSSPTEACQPPGWEQDELRPAKCPFERKNLRMLKRAGSENPKQGYVTYLTLTGRNQKSNPLNRGTFYKITILDPSKRQCHRTQRKASQLKEGKEIRRLKCNA